MELYLRKSIFLLLLIYPNLLQAQRSNDKTIPSLQSKPSVISGLIKNYTPGKGNRFITLRTYDIFNTLGNSKDTTILIDSSGSFRAIVSQAFEGDIQFMFNNEWITLFHSPGTELGLTIDAIKWETPMNKINALSLSGQTSAIIKSIINFESAYRQHHFKQEVPWSDTNKTDIEVATIRIGRMNEELAFANNYFKKNNITSSYFKKWVINDIKFKAGRDITFYTFARPRKKSLTDKALITILKDIDFNNFTSGIHNSAYYAFIMGLAGAFQIMVNINPVYKADVKQNGMNPVPVYLKLVDRYAKGIPRQLMYYSGYSSRKLGEPYIERYNNAISNTYIKAAFENRKKLVTPFVQFNILERLKNAKVDASMKARLVNIFEQEKSNYIFIDFWGIWCGPCMREMPSYKNFIQQFEGKNISFIFFGVMTEEEVSLNTKNKYGINGKFITLNDNERDLINNLLQFSSYPSHFIIAPNSIVLDNSISRISLGGGELDPDVVKKVLGYLSK